MNLIKSNIPKLSDEQLDALAMDCQGRIGSHVAGGDPIEQYVQIQRKIIGLVQEEMKKRTSLK